MTQRAPKRTPAETDAIRRKAIADHLQREQQVRIIRTVKQRKP